jgi:hypothetical protein
MGREEEVVGTRVEEGEEEVRGTREGGDGGGK